MEQNNKQRLLKSIGKVYEQANGCKLEEAFFEKTAKELNVISDYFHTSLKQSLILALVFTLSYDNYTINLQRLISYLGCNPMKLLEYSDEIEDLFTKGIIQKQDPSEKGLIMLSSTEGIILNQKILKAIMNNLPMPSLEKEKPKSLLEVLETFYLLGVQRDEEEISSIDLFMETDRLFRSSLHYPLIQRIDELKLDPEDLTLYLYAIWKTIEGEDKIDFERALKGIFDNTPQRIVYLQGLLSNDNALITKDLAEITEGDFLNDAAMKLTDLSFAMLQESGIKLFLHKKSRETIDPTKINPVALFFNEPEQRQLEILKALMREEHFAETQRRLQQKGLPKGVTVLFHGLPGTGKTEAVCQFARDSGREIYKVDMSQLKSRWFGDSEKIIKRIFTNYRECAKDCERMPVLLFNEADAIISKRRDIGTSNVAQTENAIQNILLEELENFEGILFATTNLVSNLDPAFERRFLFKVEFQKPDIAVKAKIWNSKLPNLSKAECEALATRFDFSGGQINNIVRKHEIHEIVYGLSVDFNNIVDYCKTELLSKNNGNLIGFTKG